MILSYLSAVLLALVACVIVLKERRLGSVSLASGLMLLALIQVYDQIALADPSRLGAAKRVVIFCKSAMLVAFLAYGASFRSRSSTGYRPLPLYLLSVIGFLFALAALVVPQEHLIAAGSEPGEGFLFLGDVGYWLYTGLMVLCIAALVYLEAVFASIRGTDHWRVKYEFLGAWSILGVTLFYFSQGLLYRGVNLALLPMQSAVLIVAALLIGYSRLFVGQDKRVAVSRHVVYRSFTLLAVGAYLLTLGLVGHVIKRYDLQLGSGLTYFITFLSGIVFLILLLSEVIRRRVKILVTRHFYAQKHDYREEWRGFSNALAGCRSLDDIRTAIVDRYRQLFGLRFAALYTREGGGDSFALATAPDMGGMPGRLALSPGLLGYFSETGRVMNPADGEYSPTADESAFIRAAEAWLLVPLLAGGSLEAFVVFGRQIVPERLTYEDFDLMKIMGRQAVLSLKNFQLSEELSEAREMAAVAKVSSFVIHDLKNLAYTFSLMMENAQEHIAEREFQSDLVKSIRNTVAKMNALIAKLKAFPSKRELNTEAVDLARIARETLDEIGGLRPGLEFVADLEAAETCADVQEIRKVALNLLLNACDAVGKAGRVRVRTGRRGAEAFLAVEDNGCGMSPSFVQGHLFRPFRTTKEKGLGIGLYQCRQIVEGHGGRIEVASREGEGTVFTVFLPLREHPVLADKAVSADRTASPVSA